MECYLSFTLVLLLCLYNISLAKALNRGFSVELIHPDSPKSPFYDPKENEYQRVANALHRSITHADAKIGAVANLTMLRGEYLMRYSFGTPPFQLYGVIDTATDIVWTQCKPCKTCHYQRAPMFDPSKSTTYQTIPCTFATCRSVAYTKCNEEHFCEYRRRYVGAYSQGYLSSETLTLESTNGNPIKFPKFVMGCGHNNTAGFYGPNTGLIGLSGGPVSLISQISSSVDGKFSYCLVPRPSNISSKLHFGDDAVVSGEGTVSTPIVIKDSKGLYFTTLKGFSVGDKRIEFGNPTFGSNDDKGNMYINTAVITTLLPDYIYSKLESAVANVVKLERAQDPNKVLSLCYKGTFQQLQAPKITAHFKDSANVQLNTHNTFVQVAENVICLAFQSTEYVGVLGNLAQRNILVGYDVQKKTISFKPTDCTKL
ncbi:aspartic proteinase CDR1-like [Abrus precatorius]|uniref:Aspartic proteinase CDR1-like n=1 Tax=Abrus precatorius TaxID=3816 RepID=A0A8B8LKC8_ABRPR|nr:aspartic proteinase CDR1-like [Abrus precatorius]